MLAEMPNVPNDTAAEKSCPAEYGDDAIVRDRHVSNSLLAIEGFAAFQE